MPKRLAISLINFIWYSTAFIIVLAAVTLTTGRELFPQINLDNEKLFSYLSKRTGADIHVSGLRGQWTKLYPEFNAKEILVHSDVLDLQLENAHVDIDILRSVWRRTLVIDGLFLSDVHIRYIQTGTEATPAEADIEKRWKIINNILNKNIQVRNLVLELHQQKSNQEEKIRHLRMQDFRLEQNREGKKIFLRMPGEKDGQVLTAIGDFRGDTLRNSQGILYLKADEWPLHDWLSSGSEATKNHWQSALEQSWLVNGEGWVNWDGLDSAKAITQLRIHTAEGGANPDHWPDAINGDFAAHWRSKGITTLDIHALGLESEQQNHPLLKDLRVSGSNLFSKNNQPGQWRVQTPALALQPLMTLNNYLPAGKLKDLFQSLNPEGSLKNVDLTWDNNKPMTERMLLRANVDDVTAGQWHGVPGLTHVNGYLQSGIGYGFIDLDSRNGFSMFYPGIYHEPLNFQRANGRVQWQWQPEEKTVLVGSDFVSLSSEAGEARGNFWLRLPLAGADFVSEMNLAIGLRNSHARFREQFLPFILPEHLLAWLKTSIGDADISNAGFIYRGALSGHEPHLRTVQFFADVSNGDLQFDPAWPRITGLGAHLLVDDGETVVRANAGQIYNTSIEAANITVSPQNPGIAINIDARAKGPADDGLRILKETPLKNSVGQALANWRAPKGSLATVLQLQIPLAGSATKPLEDVRVSLSDTDLLMDDLRLSFNAVNGDLNYQSDKGLSAPAINASLFGKPLNLSIASQKTAKDMTINISAKGNADMRDIASWTRLRPLQLLKGNLDFDAALSLGPLGGKPSPQIGKIQINSNMKQAAAPLPAPFTKVAGEQKPLSLTVTLLKNNRQDYELAYNKQLSGALSIRNGQLFGGEIVLLGETARQSTAAGPLMIHGSLPDTNLQEWLDLIALYNQLPDPASNSDPMYPALSFSINNATWKEYSFPKLLLSAGHENDAWRIDFDSGNANGSAFFYDNKKIPDIAVNKIKIQRKTTEENTTQPEITTIDESIASKEDNTETPINFDAIPSLNVRVDHLFVNDMDVGAISTDIRNKGNALHFENLQATGTGYRLRDGSGTTGSTLVWRKKADGTIQSEFHGLLHMQGKQPALKQLGVDMFIRGQNIYMFFDLAWPGSPQQVGVKNLAGDIYTRGENGKYLQAKPNTAMRALGIVNIATWARRLRLDFSDLNSDGISFDKYKGKLHFGDGIMEFSEPLEVTSPSSSLVLAGKAMLSKEQLDLKLTATLPVGNNAAWITALAGGLPAAAGVYLVSKIFDNQIQNITSLTYTITGPMNEPDIAFQRIAAPKK